MPVVLLQKGLIMRDGLLEFMSTTSECPPKRTRYAAHAIKPESVEVLEFREYIFSSFSMSRQADKKKETTVVFKMNT